MVDSARTSIYVGTSAQVHKGDGAVSALAGRVQRVLAALLLLVSLGVGPGVVSAHGGEHTPAIPQWYGLVVLVLGFGILGVTILATRYDALSTSGQSLAGILLGVTVAALGGIIIVQLSPVDSYSASSMPFPRTWYPIIALSVGMGTVIASALLGQLRWPTRPRYAVLGIFLGLWAAYPALIQGAAEYSHPAGYVIALAVPATAAYIVWRDGRHVLATVWQDTVSRRFGLGIGAVMLIFFVFSTGLISLVPDDGLMDGHAVHDVPAFVHFQPFASPLVTWPAVEIWLPQIPLSAGLSLGVVFMVVLLGGLVTVTAMLAAFQWRAGQGGSSQSTAGAAALVGPNACGCCGPMFAQLAVVLVGPSAAAPLYWLFVDLASPVGSFFFITSVALLTGGFVYSVNALSLEECDLPQHTPEQPGVSA